MGGMATFTPDADAFRFYEDGTESGSSPLADQGVNPTGFDVTSNAQFQLRWRVQETGGADGATTDDYSIEYRLNGGGPWIAITASSSVVQADTGSTLSDGSATTNRGTDGISDGSGSFVAGEQEAGNGTIEDRQLTASNFTEHVYGLLAIAADLATNDFVLFRLRLNGGAMSSLEPQITVTKTAVSHPSGVIGGGIGSGII